LFDEADRWRNDLRRELQQLLFVNFLARSSFEADELPAMTNAYITDITKKARNISKV